MRAPSISATRCFRWPVRPRRQSDELLSSWLTRAARANGVRPYVFCSAIWPKKQVWNRDVDWVGDPELLAELARQTQLDLCHVRTAVLGDFEGRIFREHRLNAKTAWVLPVGVYHRIRDGYGLQFCPLCLLEDAAPYFRRSWRLGFVTACRRHGIVLHDRCPSCSQPLNPHRVPLHAASLRYCFSCGGDVAEAAECRAAEAGALAFQDHLVRIADLGWASVPGRCGVDGPAYFAIVHQLLRLLATGRFAARLRDAASALLGQAIPAPTFAGSAREMENLAPSDRHSLLHGVGALMVDWPNTFVEFCRWGRIWSSTVLRDMEQPPFILLEPVMRELYRASYIPNDQEIQAAAAWFWRTRGKVPIRSVKRFISTASRVAERAKPPRHKSAPSNGPP